MSIKIYPWNLLYVSQMGPLVERILELHKQQAASHLPQEKELLERQIAATDDQIDRLVYKLYGLT